MPGKSRSVINFSRPIELPISELQLKSRFSDSSVSLIPKSRSISDGELVEEGEMVGEGGGVLIAEVEPETDNAFDDTKPKEEIQEAAKMDFDFARVIREGIRQCVISVARGLFFSFLICTLTEPLMHQPLDEPKRTYLCVHLEYSSRIYVSPSLHQHQPLIYPINQHWAPC